MCFAPQWRTLFRHLNFQKWSDHGVHFHLEMCFAPQRRALFRHLNFQKWSDHGVFCTFSLGNVLRATTACNFSSLIWPAGSAPATLASLLFDPPEPQIIGKTQRFATFLPFRASASLSSDSFSSTLLSSNLSLLSASALLCFSSIHIVGSLTSKFPSITFKEKQGRSASPPKQIGNPYFHMQGAGLNVILKVYMLHNMHPGNMWNAGQGTKMQNSFHWMLSSCWFKISLYKPVVLKTLVWFRAGWGFEHHLDDNANF